MLVTCYLKQMTVWRLNGFGHQNALITDKCNFMSYMNFLSFGRDGAVQTKNQAGQHSSPSCAMHSRGPGYRSDSLSGSSPHTQIDSPLI